MNDPPPDVENRASSASWPGEAPELAIVVPTHARAPFLPELVDALERQELDRSRFEVVIVDDSSPDATWEVLSTLVGRTPLRMSAVRSASNRGPAAARNLGVSVARAPMLAFTDDDCLPAPGWAATMLAELRSGADVVQGRTIPRPEDRASHGAWARTVWIEKQTPLFESCNIGWKRESFSSLGGFPEARPDVSGATRWHFGEDAALGWRLRANGGRTAFVAEALVHHRVFPGNFRDWLNEQRRLALFPGLVRRAPGLGGELKFGVFLTNRTALFDLALAGSATAAGMLNPWPLLALLPWAAARLKDAGDRPGRPRVFRLAQLGVGDAVGFVSLVVGSVRSRRLVL